MGPYLASVFQRVNLAPVWGLGVRGGLGTSFKLPGGLGTMGPLWEEWSAGRLLAQPSQSAPQAGPHPTLPAGYSALSPQVLPAAEKSSQPPHLACLVQTLGTRRALKLCPR